MKTTLNVNGETRQVDVSPDTPLLWVLRDTLGLTGTKYSCGKALCGSCTVLVDGGILRSLSATLYGEITIENGGVVQGNFDTYPLLRIGEAPEIEVFFIKNEFKPQGLGEMAFPAAVANAIFAATGKRIRRLPIRPEDLS